MSKTDFNQLFTDLSENIAQKLRKARLKPEQIKKMADGEILAIEGIGDVALEKIRALYPVELPDSTEKKAKTKKIKKDKKETKETKKPKAKKRKKSARYLAWSKKLDKTKLYSLEKALKIITPTQNRPNTVELHINVTETNIKGEIELPHAIIKPLHIAIFSDSLASDIKAGKYKFDILLAKPKDMAKVAPLAKILGPRGLMPNPKNKTVTADPEKRAKQLQSGTTLSYKTESKSPIIHINLGKTSQDHKHIKTNIAAILKDITAKKIKSAFLASTQSPSVKLDLSFLTD
jgi:large subunit ribosomal protein L1